MKLLDQARLGDYRVSECAQQEWTLIQDRAATRTLLNETVAIDITNVAYWMADEWSSKLPDVGIMISLDVFPNIKPSFPAMWFEFRTRVPGVTRAIWAIESDDAWYLSFWEHEGKTLDLTHCWTIHQDPTGKILFGQYVPAENETKEELSEWISSHSTLVLLAQDLMHCKNVVLERQPKPPKLVKSFKKKHNGVGPAVYSVINIQPMQTIIRKAGGVEKIGHRRAFGIIRGNYATYTEERPLFGKITGRFFRPAHHVGDPAIGIKKSDYAVQPPKKKQAGS